MARLIRTLAVAAMAASVTAACGDGATVATTAGTPGTPPPSVSATPPVATTASTSPPSACVEPPQEEYGVIADPALVEISGMAASRTHLGVLWVHNDSGDDPVVYALDPSGAVLGAHLLEGAAAVDWEDMAVGPGPDPQRDYLYLGDIGDNGTSREGIAVYRVPEPAPAGGDPIPAAAVESLHLTYPDGARNAETLLVDPTGGDMYVVTKSLDGAAEVYRAPPNGGRMTRAATLDLGPGGATGGDIAAGRDRLAIRTYFTLYVWAPATGESLVEALTATPCSVRVRDEMQGEAVAIGPGGELFTVSEGAGQTVHRYTDPVR